MSRLSRVVLGYAAAVTGVVAAALLLRPWYDRIDSVTAATAMLLIVLLTSIRFGMGPAIVASLLGAVYLNSFLIPPEFGFRLAGGDDLVALASYLLTATLVGQLSSRAQRRAHEAEQNRREVERLYEELKTAFERTSELEAIRRSEQMKSALLDTVTHDLRTPLTSIKAAATTLASRTDARAGLPALAPDVSRELLEVIVEECDRLNHFFEEMLETAKLQGGLPTEHATETADEIITAALQRARNMVARHELHTDIEGDATARICDARAVSQVLYTLVENSAKYAPPNTRIFVRVRIGDTEAEFSVQDEGPGISTEDRERVFERFFRKAPAGSAELPPGLGMGLAIARGLVESVGGRIWVDDAPSGACVRFTVPVLLNKSAEVVVQ